MTCRLYYIVNALSTVNIHHLACDQHRTTKVLRILIAKKPVIPLRSPHLLCKTPFFFLQALSNFNKLNIALLWAHSAVIFFFFFTSSNPCCGWVEVFTQSSPGHVPFAGDKPVLSLQAVFKNFYVYLRYSTNILH